MKAIENAVLEAMVYINLNLFEHITLDVLSERFSYSKYYLHRSFKIFTGITINEYIRKRRIEHSLYFLFANMDASLSEVAGYCGFSSAVYSREFKKVLNHSPKQWRNLYQKSMAAPKDGKICKNYEQFIDYNDQGIPNEVHRLCTVREGRKALSAAILYGDCTASTEDCRSRLEACNTGNRPYIGIPINSPAVTDPASRLFVLGFENDAMIPGFSDIVIEEGDYLRIEFSGSREKMREVLTWLFKFYMPSKNVKHDYRLQYIVYPSYPDFSASELCCDVYIPFACC